MLFQSWAFDLFANNWEALLIRLDHLVVITRIANEILNQQFKQEERSKWILSNKSFGKSTSTIRIITSIKTIRTAVSCFLSQEEPKTISQALEDERWLKICRELLQFKLQKVWILVDLPFGKKTIGTKWVFRNKRDERSIVVKNKARLVAQGFKHEEGIDLIVRFFMDYWRRAYMFSTQALLNPAHLNKKVLKVIQTLYGLHLAPRAWYEWELSLSAGVKMVFREFEDCYAQKILDSGSMGELGDHILFGIAGETTYHDGIFIVKDKFPLLPVVGHESCLSLRTKHTLRFDITSYKGIAMKILVDVTPRFTLMANVEDLLTKDLMSQDLELILIRDKAMNLRKDGSFAELKMANLRYGDKHNMVAFIKKPTKVLVGFYEIGIFSKNATVRTLANRIQELVASIDNKEYTITEASIRSRLQLADATSAYKHQIKGEGSAIQLAPNTTPDPSTIHQLTPPPISKQQPSITPPSGNFMSTPLRVYEAPIPEDCSRQGVLMGKAVLTVVLRGLKLLEAALKRKSQWTKLFSLIKGMMKKRIRVRKIHDIDDVSSFLWLEILWREKEAVCYALKVASQNVSTYKRRARSASKGKDIGIGMDFFIAAKERLNSAKVEVNTEVNPGSVGVNTGNTPLVHLDALLAKKIQEEQELSEQQ
ncbi:putative ribonuclease H-like domain-containing protein [Tanacetum coccineum]